MFFTQTQAMQIRFNLSVLEQWCREHQIPNCNEVIDQLNPITQATKLLQTKKTEDNISTIVEMCNKLTSSQIMKILNLYTAVDEENISADFLKKIQSYLREQRKDGEHFVLSLDGISRTRIFEPNPALSLRFQMPTNPHCCSTPSTPSHSPFPTNRWT